MIKPTYRMSRAGDCPRVLSAIRLGYSPAPDPEWLKIIGRESTRHEEWVVEDLRNEGYDVERGGVCIRCLEEFGEERKGIHVELEFNLFRLVGHLDGRVIAGNVRRPLEIKALGRFTFYKFRAGGFEAFGGYAAQETCYLEAVQPANWPGLYVVKNRDTGSKIILNVPSPPTDMNLIVDKISWVEASARLGRLVEAECDPDSEEYRFCRFGQMLCPQIPSQVGEIPPEVGEALEVWKSGHVTAKKVEVARQVVRDYMSMAGLPKLEVQRVVATSSPVHKPYYIAKLLRENVSNEVLAKCQGWSDYFAVKLQDLDEEPSEE